MSNLQSFVDRFRSDPAMAARIDAMGAERGLEQIDHFFCLLEQRTDVTSLKLRAEIEQIINGEGTISARCFAIQRAIRNALPAMIKLAGH